MLCKSCGSHYNLPGHNNKATTMTSNEEVTERWIPSHLQFRIAYWSCESCRIINLKKQAMQIMTFNRYSVHCEPLFKEKYQKSKIHLVSTAWNFRIEPYETSCHITMRAISCEPCMQPVITLLFYNFALNGSCLSFETFNDNFPHVWSLSFETWKKSLMSTCTVNIMQ